MRTKFGKLVRSVKARVVAGSLLATVAGSAMAGGGPTFDTGDVLAAIAAAAVAVGLIGAAVTSGPVITKAAWGWIRSTAGR